MGADEKYRWQAFDRPDNGNGLAGLIIKTSAGQTCTVGTQLTGPSYFIATEYLGSGLLVGFDIIYWNNNTDIAGSRPIFFKPLLTISMAMDFGDREWKDTELYSQPMPMAGAKFINKTSESQDWVFKDSISKAISHEWTASSAMMFGVSVSLEAGFLGFAKASTTASWNRTLTQTTSNKITDTATISWGINVSIATGMTVDATVVLWQGMINLPYTATFTVKMVPSLNLSDFTFIDSGIYTNVQYSTAQVTISEAETPPTKALPKASIHEVLAEPDKPTPLTKTQAEIQVPPVPVLSNGAIAHSV
jgi:hypothetical protein